ncbi:hydroxyacylglutathione hydrolase [Bdellovibrio svalbardensis]|uniref:Hydroxyacylglutathione hydrolase n=1 Tax=Bdellovibrio svalbardensis TaxID=2972972 RepID=A0ABT6DKJ3_9BACT|nr:hydroxyacylglutathione hydrolase [Bdellovibrio svalbardensis]MDG0816361.1 hydroxyacylglutathione hydrolase [Bdellovibrio svalbardensis]
MNTTRPRVELLPIFEDNYVFLLIDDDTQEAVVIDPGEASKVMTYLNEHGLTLKGVLITHHHKDHIAGVRPLIEKYPAPVFAPMKNKSQIPDGQFWVQEGDEIDLGSMHFSVMELPGHTLGHVAFWNDDLKWLFSGDVLFGLGCGRLFEGTYEQMYNSLQRIKNLPPETLIYCTHEYTEMNLQFCKMLSSLDDSPITGDDEDLEMYENQLLNLRGINMPSVPLKLAIETKVNPFLLAHSLEQFTYLRELRNKQ